MGMGRGDDSKHLGTIAGKNKNLPTANLKSWIQNCQWLSADAT